MLVAELAIDIRDDVHDVGVALDRELLVRVDRADLRHPAHIVAAEIEQHQVLGPFLGIGEQLLLQGLVLGRRGAAGPGPRDRANRHLAVADPHHDLGTGADDLEAAPVVGGVV